MAVYKPYIKKENGSISELPVEANKVANPITIKLNGGTTEGTNQYTFDGSKSITTDITPSSIGAATQQAIDEINSELENHIVECNCTHEVEITGFGEEDCNLAIDDQDVVITKIQGQTRRKSLNLLDESLVTVTNSVIRTENISLSNGIYTVSIQNASFSDGQWQVIINETVVETMYLNTTLQYTFSITSKSNVRIYANNNGSINAKVMLNEGSTALPFEPFDDTLVNSKCDFVSTGRNLFNIKDSAENTINGIKYSIKDGIVSLDGTSTSGYTDIYLFGSSTDNGEYLHIPKGSYSMNLFENGIPSGISLFMREKTQETAYSNNDILKMLEKNDCYFYGILVRVGTEGQTLTCSNATMRLMIVNGSKVPTVFEPYVEDTMKCGLELGQWDYHDNINHITHRQTGYTKGKNYLSNSIMNNGAGNPYVHISGISVNSVDDIICNCNKVDQDAWWNNTFNDVTLTFDANSNNLIIMLPNGATDTSALNNNIDIRYKLATETTVTNILPSGYKVWYKGMQTQKTETIPYILTKQYGISLASQVLNNVSVDRSQQKQIDEIKNVPKLYNHFLQISFTSGNRTYKFRVNILSTVNTKITSLNDFYNVCKAAKNIYEANSSEVYYWSMPAEGSGSNNTSYSQDYIIFKLFVYYDHFGEKVFYVYYISKNTGAGNNFDIVNSHSSSPTFSDTVTTIYGGQ